MRRGRRTKAGKGQGTGVSAERREQRLRFAGCEFDPRRGELRRRDEVIALTPQALALLSYLLDHRDRAVSRAELLDEVWGNVVVSDGALSTAMYELRAALGDDGQQQQVIRTLRGRGFMFAAPVQEPPVAAPPSGVADAPATPVRAPFVGRGRLLEQLSAALAGAGQGQGHVVALEGEAGIGKTRLARHFAAGVRDAQVWFGRCYEHTGAPPFWPWTQVLREPFAAAEPAELRRLFGARAGGLMGFMPERRELLPRLRGTASNGAEARFQLFDSVAALLRHASTAAPLVLILDDVHCADQASLLLLEFLAAELAQARVLLVATYRGEEVGDGNPLAATLAALARQPHYERHVLDGLEPPEVRQLLTTLAGTIPSPAALESVVRRSEGNPLFISELARQLDGRGDTVDQPGSLPLPVQEIIRRRVARLAPITQQALGVASVLGRDVRLEVLARTWDGCAPLPPAWLDDAVRAQVLTPAGRTSGSVRFTHALFQEALYTRLDPVRRATLHRRAGEALEAGIVAPTGADLAALAHHFIAALPTGGDTGKAVAYSVAAAGAARELLAYEESVQHHARALHALEYSGQPDPLSYAEVLLGLGEAQDQAGTADPAFESFLRAATAARRADAPVLLARAALGYAAARDRWARMQSNQREEATRTRAAALLDEALAALRAGETELHARVMAALAVTATRLSSAERERLSHAAVQCAERLRHPALLAEVVSARRELLWAPDNIEQRLEMANTIVALAQHTGDREQELRGRAWRLIDLLELGEIAEVRHEVDSCDRLAEHIGQLKYRHYVAVLRAGLALLAGRFDDVERESATALALGRRMRSDVAEIIYTAHQVAVRRERGGLAAVEPMVRQAVLAYPLHLLRCSLAFVLSELERVDEARAQFELLAKEDFADIPRDSNFVSSLGALAEVCFRLADRSRAALLYDLLLPFADRNVVSAEGVSSFGAAAHHLGELATVLERWETAERHFRAAMAFNRCIDAPAYAGQIERAYGEMFLARGAPGDRERALSLLDAARQTAERFGAHALRRRVLTIRERALALRAAPSDKPGQPTVVQE